MKEIDFIKIESDLIKIIFNILFELSENNEEFSFEFSYGCLSKIPRTSSVSIEILKNSEVINILNFFLIEMDYVVFTCSTIQEYIEQVISCYFD